MNEDIALQNSVVWACQRIIAETVASLPLHLLRRTPAGKEIAVDHPLYKVLHDEPNPQMSDFQFRETLTSHCLLWGNAFATKVTRPDGVTIGLWPLDPKTVEIREDEPRKVRYIHHASNGDITYTPDQIFHLAGLGFDGVRGYSVVTMARNTIALAQIQEEYASRFFASGGRRPYYLRKPTRFKNDQEFEQFRQRHEQSYSSPDAFHRTMILEGDIEYHEIGMSLEDAQFLASREFSIPEICRWFRISPHLVGDLSRATFSNIEHLSIEFVQHTLMSWLVRWEKAINRQLLTGAEKGTYFAKHNVAALLRGDFESRMKGYSIGIQNGVYSINEVRDLEDMNPVAAGDGHYVPLNLQKIGGGGTQ
jgi:HK97 family phage portal protein